MKKSLPTLLNISLALSLCEGIVSAESTTTIPTSTVEILPTTTVPHQSAEPKGNALPAQTKRKLVWAVALDAQVQQQDLTSNLDSSGTKEKTERLLLHGRRQMIVDESKLSLDLFLGYQQSRFDYRGGQAELDLDGYSYGFELSYQPRQCKKINVDLGLANSHLEGRDFVDHLTGATGLTLDSKLKEFRYFIVPSYELYQFSSSYSQHAFRAHLGFEERTWEMNMGWYTNPKEKMNIDQPWLAGLSYQWVLDSSSSMTYHINLRGDVLDEGYRAKLVCSMAF